MDTHRLALFIWLWVVCVCVECLPEVRLSSRQQKEGQTSITINFYIDVSVNTTKDHVESYLGNVILQAMNDLRSFFALEDVYLYYSINYLMDDPNLQSALTDFKNTDYIYLDRAIDALTAYFIDGNPPDIVCLVTKSGIYNGDDVIKAYGYSKDKTLCEIVVSMLLAYAPSTAGYASRMLAEMIRDSVNPEQVPYVHQRYVPGGSFGETMKEYLRTCNQGFSNHKLPGEHTPPNQGPNTPPEKPELPPGPPPPPDTPDTKPPPAQPQPPVPPAPIPPVPPVPPETPLPPERPQPPDQSPSKPEEPPTSAPEPDYC
uniref:Putative p32 protein n=1 Tax=Ixodes ricinus TaxID=34613 RepID=A0A0K8R6G2_IXORI